MLHSCEDRRQGRVTWHSTEEDGGPDVGISVYLGDQKRLWCGEISDALFVQCKGGEHFGSPNGWFIVFYGPEPMLIAKCGDQENAKAMVETIAWLAREVDAPTLARTLSAMDAA